MRRGVLDRCAIMSAWDDSRADPSLKVLCLSRVAIDSSSMLTAISCNTNPYCGHPAITKSLECGWRVPPHDQSQHWRLDLIQSPLVLSPIDLFPQDGPECKCIQLNIVECKCMLRPVATFRPNHSAPIIVTSSGEVAFLKDFCAVSGLLAFALRADSSSA